MDRELDDDDLIGLPGRVEPDDSEVVVDPPPKLIKVSESGRLAGPLANAQGMYDLADTAASGSPGRRRQARSLVLVFFVLVFGINIIGLLFALIAHLL